MTAQHLAKRGYCCGNACLHCPYNYAAVQPVERRRVLRKRNEPVDDSVFRAATKRTSLPELFNPFRQRDAACDLPGAARLRRANLAAYFAALDILDRPRDLWLAEAPGATGTRRTGIPLVDERELALANAAYTINPPLQRATITPVSGATSTGLAIWEQIERTGQCPVLWNVLLHHPQASGPKLGNRSPRAAEVRHFTPLIKLAYERWCLGADNDPLPRVIAIGKFAERAALDLKLPNVHYVRHPAQGGLTTFRERMAALYADATDDTVAENVAHQ